MNQNILLINDNLDTGGVEKILRSLAARLDRRGDRLTVWASNGDRETLRRCYPPGTRLRRYPFWDFPCRRFSPRWFYARACRVFFEGFLLRLKRWDVIVAVKEGPSMRLASRLRARKKIAWVHTDYAHFHWSACHFRSPEAERACMARFDKVICVSQAVLDSVVQTVGDPGNLLRLYSPIDVEAVLSGAGERPADCVRPQGKTLLVSAGRLSPVKRCGLMIEACARLSERYPLELWLIGGGEQEQELRQLIEQRGLDCVKLLGRRDDPFPYVACADWVLSASASESYGLSIQEALILGVPVLASACPAITETLDSRFGLLTGPEPEDFIRGLEEVLSHPELGRQRREALRGFDRSALWEPRMQALCQLISAEKE